MTPERQCELSREAGEHVRRALGLVGLSGNRRGRERTSAAAQDRLAARLAEPDPTDQEERRRILAARAELATATRLWWELALTARKTVIREAKHRAGPMPEEECVQEGWTGAYQAARRFDPDRGIKFATYARWWVRAMITRAIEQTGRAIRLTGCAAEKLRTADKASGTEAERAAAVGWTAEQLREARATRAVSSIERIAPGTDGKKRLEDLLEAPAVDLDDAIDDARGAARVRAALPSLPDRLRRVLELRTSDVGAGAKDGWGCTHVEAGRKLGLCRERARQLQREAEGLLREMVADGALGPRAEVA